LSREYCNVRIIKPKISPSYWALYICAALVPTRMLNGACRLRSSFSCLHILMTVSTKDDPIDEMQPNKNERAESELNDPASINAIRVPSRNLIALRYRSAMKKAGKVDRTAQLLKFE
jgi:hypothetical protein